MQNHKPMTAAYEEKLKNLVRSTPDFMEILHVARDVNPLGNDDLYIVAPLALEDLFGLVWRRNARRVTVKEFRRRLVRKRVPERWPKATIDEGS
jgi:hypothetical protein